LVEIPAMIDYVNHLARMHLFVDAAAGRPNPAYEIHWRFYPNLAMDLIVPVLAGFVSVESAARLFLLATQTLVVSGAIVLEIAVRGRHQLSGFAALMALYSLPFLWELMNEDSLDYLPTTISQLNSASAGGTAPAHGRGWRTDYGYLYIVGDQTASVPDRLTSMMRSRRFTLYAIGK